MAEADTRPSASKAAAFTPIAIETNSIGTIYLSEHETLQKFAELNSERVASMLAILMERHEDIEPSFMADMLEMANDLAYQVQQAVRMLATEKAGA